ncbi:MAG: hypothetical protein MJ082_05845 [Clostridia bacterium]|nr:hypothetical protein [Clostridia bacterium]
MHGETSTVHQGHRDRMRTKFLRLGASAFESHELLEMLLYTVIPYQDTNPIAHRLMARFKTLSGVFSASVDELSEVEGVGKKTAEFLAEFAEYANDCLLLKDDSPCFDDYRTAKDYFLRYFDGKTEAETVMVLLDNKMSFLGVEKIADTDFSSSCLRPVPFIEKALLSDAAVVMIAHNHPRGPLFPSEGDRAAQCLLKSAMECAGIALAEHFLICGRQALGLISHTERSFHQYPALSKFYQSADVSGEGDPVI